MLTSTKVGLLSCGFVLTWFLFLPNVFIVLTLSVFLLLFIFLPRKIFFKLNWFFVAINLFLLLPMTSAVNDYLKGKAKIKTLGYPSATIGNINPECRLKYDPTGCVISPWKVVNVQMYNRTAKTMISHFGFQKDSYTGPILEQDIVSAIFDSHSLDLGIASLEDEILKIQFDNIDYEIDLGKQHGMHKKTILSHPIKEYPRIFKYKSLLVCELNARWLYTIDIKENQILNTLNPKNSTFSLKCGDE